MNSLTQLLTVNRRDGDASTTVIHDDKATAGVSLYEAITKPAPNFINNDSVRQIWEGGDGIGFTTEQLERVINHLVDMMAHSFLRATTKFDKRKDLKYPEGRADLPESIAGKLDRIWSVYYDIFKSDQIYGANLESLDQIQVLIDHIIKRDHLPPHNSKEAQHLLRDAWNTVDV